MSGGGTSGEPVFSTRCTSGTAPTHHEQPRPTRGCLVGALRMGRHGHGNNLAVCRLVTNVRIGQRDVWRGNSGRIGITATKLWNQRLAGSMMTKRESRADPLRIPLTDTPMTKRGSSGGPVRRCSITNPQGEDRNLQVSTIGYSQNPARVFPVTTTYRKGAS